MGMRWVKLRPNFGLFLLPFVEYLKHILGFSFCHLLNIWNTFWAFPFAICWIFETHFGSLGGACNILSIIQQMTNHKTWSHNCAIQETCYCCFDSPLPHPQWIVMHDLENQNLANGHPSATKKQTPWDSNIVVPWRLWYKLNYFLICWNVYF
jgi:hypothetical protein